MTLITSLVGFLSGVIGAMGLGGGGVLLISLTAFASVEQLTAQGINLLFFPPVGLSAIIIYSIKKQIRWKTVLLMWAGGILGAVLGFLAARFMGGASLSKLFACFLIVFGISRLFAKVEKQKKDV